MLKYSEDSEAFKVRSRDLKKQVLSPNEPSVNMVRFARQARSEKIKKMFQIFQTWRERDPSRQYFKMLVVLERECLEHREEVEHVNERQEVLTVLMEGKIALEKYQEKIFEDLKELEEQKTREALELLQRRLKLVKLEMKGNE